MNNEVSNWEDVLLQVPEAAASAPIAKDASLDGGYAGSVPGWASPLQLVTSLAAVAAGRSGKKISNILRADLDQRMRFVRKDMNTPKKVTVVSITMLAAVTLGVLLLPASITDLDDYFLDVGMSTVVTGLLSAGTLIASVIIERRSVPRSLPYVPALLIVYAVLFTLGVALLSRHITRLHYWFLPSAQIGVALAAITALGYFALFFCVRKQPTMLQALHGDTPQGREYDDALRTHITKVLRRRNDIDPAEFRAVLVSGVKGLYENQTVTAEKAAVMLREVVGMSERLAEPH